jgi:hypothetical protein
MRTEKAIPAQVFGSRLKPLSGSLNKVKKTLVALCRTPGDRNIGWQEDDLLSQGVIEKQHQRGVGQLLFLTYIKYSQAVKKSKPVGTNLFSVRKHAARCTTSNRTYDCLRRCAKKNRSHFLP